MDASRKEKDEIMTPINAIVYRQASGAGDGYFITDYIDFPNHGFKITLDYDQNCNMRNPKFTLLQSPYTPPTHSKVQQMTLELFDEIGNYRKALDQAENLGDEHIVRKAQVILLKRQQGSNVPPSDQMVAAKALEEQAKRAHNEQLYAIIGIANSLTEQLKSFIQPPR
jgi:hypothetical protein